MPKWLVTHQLNNNTVLQDVIEAEDYTKAYLKVLYKSPEHYADGKIYSGIVSVVRLPDEND